MNINSRFELIFSVNISYLLFCRFLLKLMGLGLNVFYLLMILFSFFGGIDLMILLMMVFNLGSFGLIVNVIISGFLLVIVIVLILGVKFCVDR